MRVSLAITGLGVPLFDGSLLSIEMSSFSTRTFFFEQLFVQFWLFLDSFLSSHRLNFKRDLVFCSRLSVLMLSRRLQVSGSSLSDNDFSLAFSCPMSFLVPTATQVHNLTYPKFQFVLQLSFT